MGVSIVLAEDTFIVREGVKLLLDQAGYDLKASVEDYPDLIEAVEKHNPDVVITDIRMPGGPNAKNRLIGINVTPARILYRRILKL